MKPLALTVFLLGSFLGSSTALADGYKFHLSITDGRTALLLGPESLWSHYTEEQLARLTSSQQFVFTKVNGAHFTWLAVGCPLASPDCEFAITASGTCVGRGCDFAFRRGGTGALQMRCLRESCAFVAVRAGQTVSKKLKAREEATFPLDSDFDVEFEGPSVASFSRQ